MHKSTRRPTPRRAPVRTASHHGAVRTVGRPPRRSGPNLVPLLIIGIIVIALGAGGFLFWQSRQSQAAPDPPAATPAVVETLEPSPTPSPTLPVVAAGSVPGAAATIAPPNPVAPTELAPTAAAPANSSSTAAASPIAQSTAQPAAPLSTATVRPAATVVAPAATAAAPQPAAPTASAPQPGGASQAGGPDIAALARQMLALVNADREANGLQPVAWDQTAAIAGQEHSEEMVQFGFMSHWNMDGYGPEYRYSRAGGLDMSQENVYRLVHQWEDGRGAPIDNWAEVIANAQVAWMNSPGHRANILAPEHTHLGFGMAYNPLTGNVAMAQEFVNRYVSVEPLPRRAQPGDRLVLRGTLLAGSTDPLVNLAYEPFPSPMTLEQLNQTGAYQSAAQHLAVPQVRTDAGGRFVSEFTLPKDAPPGLYHVWLWVRSPVDDERVQAVNAVIEVSE